MRSLLKLDEAKTVSRQSKIVNAYTHTPQLYPQPIIASLQLLAWLFLHPSAWRSYVTQLDPNLRPNFCLVELNGSQWCNPALHRLLVIGYLIPLLVGLAVSLGLQPLGIAGEGAPHGVVIGLAIGLVFGLALSLASGIVVGVMAEIVFGLVFGRPGLLIVDLVIGLALGVVFGLVSGAASHVADSTGRQPLTHSLPQQIGGIIIGLLISAVVIAATVGAVLGLITSLPDRIGDPAIAGIGNGVGLGMLFATVTGRRTRRWQHGVLFGLLVGTVTGIMFGVLFYTLLTDHIGGLHLILALEIISAALFSGLFILPYVLAGQTAGPWAGAIAGAVSCGAGHLSVWTVISLYRPWPNALINWVIVVLSLTMGWWRPVLFYPFQIMWACLLRRLDEQQLPRQVSWLRWHPAFWDEFQWLRWPGLDNYLVQIAERNPAEGQAAITYLATGRQRWAAQSAQIELEIHRLKHCPNIEALSKVYPGIITGELTGPVNGLLHSFSRLSRDIQAALNQITLSHQRLALSAIERRLGALYYELSVSPNAYAQRFHPLAAQWHQIVARHGQDLARVVELRQEIDNVYLYSVPLTLYHQTFVGRTRLATKLEQLLLKPGTPAVLLYGQRRMGKTSFLRNLDRLLPQAVTTLFVDGEKVAGAGNYADFLYNIAQEVTKSAASLPLILPALPCRSLEAEPLRCFNHWLDTVEQILKATGHPIIIFALDEIEALDRVSGKGRLDQADILNTLRHLSEHRPYFKLLLAGSYPLEELGAWAALNHLQPIKIGYLEEAEARQLIEQPVTDFALRYEPDASQEILKLTRGHPHLIQLLCHEVVNLKNKQDPSLRRVARLADVEAAVPGALSHGGFFFAAIDSRVGPAGRALLRLLARSGVGVKRVELFDCLEQSDDDIDQSLVLLTRHDLIESVEESYRFQIELVRRWFAR